MWLPWARQPVNRSTATEGITLSPLQARRLGAALYYGSLRGFGLTALERRFRDAGLILCYHNVVPAADAGIGDPGLHLPCERFKEQMRWLRDHYQVVSLREFVDRLAADLPVEPGQHWILTI